MGTLIICMGLVWYFSRRITKPIQELAELSDRMANLDFEAKYTSGGKNEIGELGDNLIVCRRSWKRQFLN